MTVRGYIPTEAGYQPVETISDTERQEAIQTAGGSVRSGASAAHHTKEATMVIFLDTDELRELLMFLTDRRKALFAYISDKELTFDEARALLGAAEKIERENRKAVAEGDI